ncbi:MAG: methylmalonyl-CoA mutase family protein [Candidatus Cloacimonetes bacterium]|nr:methylmalonyl-CoA mutase family protein [Candidatus Cloacimonadota bacterium]
MEKSLENPLPKELNLLNDFPPPTYEEWKAAAEKLLKGAPFDKVLKTTTYENIILEPMYRLEDIENLQFPHSLPGFKPFVRGNRASGYTSKPWKISQDTNYSDPIEFNRALKVDLQNGQTEINFTVSYKTEHKYGLVIDSYEDIKKAFAGIDCAEYSFRIRTFFNACEIFALFLKFAEEKEFSLAGSFVYDPISELLCLGRLVKPFESIVSEYADFVRNASKKNPNLRFIGIEGITFNHAGSSITQELAFTFSAAIEYVRAYQKLGLDVDFLAPKMNFTLSLGSNFFMEIAKIRAARMIWSQIVEEFGGNEDSQRMYIHGQTSLHNKTVYDPYVNVLRTTTEAFAGVLGGVDSLQTGCFDEAVRIPQDFSRRIARNQQLILMEEANLNKVIDPAGGSWYIEYMTNELAEKTWDIINMIEQEGGMLQAILKELPQTMISKITQEKQRNLAVKKDSILGTNLYIDLSERLIEKELSNCTEIAKGDYPVTVNPLRFHRAAESFEAIRNASEKYLKEKGKRPTVFIASIGQISALKLRIEFCEEFMRVGSFNVISGNLFNSIKEAVQKAVDSNADIIVICSQDSDYPSVVPEFINKIKEMKYNSQLILAGYPKDIIEEMKSAGIDDFIFVKANALEIFTRLWSQILKKPLEEYLIEKQGGNNE